VDIIDLGVGDPDLPTPAFIVQKMAEAIQDPETHHYPAYSGMNLFREAVARWYQGRFGVDLDPESEVLTLIGSKEGIAHLPLGINNPEDINLMTSPGYPVYQMGTLFAGAYCHFLPLTRENRFLPDLRAIPPLVARDAKAFFFNYPNNPTAAVADKEFFRPGGGLRRNIRLSRSTTPPTPNWPSTVSGPSFLETPGAKEIGIEVPFAVQDLQHDGVAPGDGGGQPGGVGRPGQDQEQHRFRGL
jgi:LL-diaminopimelate aminotransferase